MSGSAVFDVFRRFTPGSIKRGGKKVQERVQTLLAKRRCPVCNARVPSFEPLPEFYVDNQRKYGFPFTPDDSETCNHREYFCPRCHSSDRDRLYALFLQDYLSNAGINNVSRIIDFAPSAPLSAFIRRRIADSAPPVSYRTADYSGIGVDDQVDITDLQPYADGQFDFFICSHVLEHVTDDRKALSELRRILQPGGKGILMVPIIPSLNEVDEAPNVSDEGERWRRFGQDDHVRIYSKNGFIERVVQSGFEVQQLGKDFFSEASFSRAGITPQSVLYIVEKI